VSSAAAGVVDVEVGVLAVEDDDVVALGDEELCKPALNPCLAALHPVMSTATATAANARFIAPVSLRGFPVRRPS
jgi:hypothetical protein